MDEGADGISEFDLYWLNMGNSVVREHVKQAVMPCLWKLLLDI